MNEVVPLEHYCCIDEALAVNDELTASDLKDTLIKRFVWCENHRQGEK